MAAQMLLNFYPDQPDGKLIVTCRLDEGDMTITKGDTPFGLDYQYAFTDRLIAPDMNSREIYNEPNEVTAYARTVGDKVVITGRDSSGRLLVRKKTASDPVAHGEIYDKIDFVGIVPNKLGTYTSGTYERREADVLIYGKAIRTLPTYVAQSANIGVGDYITYCNVEGYEKYMMKTATANNRISLEAVTASGTGASTVKLPILIGFEG